MSTPTSPTSASRIPTSPLEPTDRLRRADRKGWTPPPRVSVPEWADRFRHLAPEAGSTKGRWKTATVEIARGPMLAVTEPGVHTITVQCCTQLMKTALLENVFGYFAHLDPCPMLLLQPKEDAAEQFSKERISPMVRVTPVLRELVGSSKTRSAEETLLFKAFPGGFLALAGAGSPDNLARRPIRLLLCDEVDKYPVTREGDPIDMAEERTASFGANWLSIRACSPTIEGESRIETAEGKGDQRRASVECPHCQHRQFLDFFTHVHGWQGDTETGSAPDAKKAQIYCESCGCAWSEGQRLQSLRTIRWHQTRPFVCCGERQAPLESYGAAWREEPAGSVERVWAWSQSPRHAVFRACCRSCGALGVPNDHASFQAGKLYSPWSKDKPSDIARKFVNAGADTEKLQVWWNTQAGLTYRPHASKAIDSAALAARTEVWDAEVPNGVAMITIGGDVQGDRVELEVVGWGRNEESWSIAHLVVEGDPDLPETWERVDSILKRTWRRADGRTFACRAACIDSGGSSTSAVYTFCKARLGRYIWAIKGESARNGTRSPIWPTKRPSLAHRSSFRPVIIGVNAAKDVVRGRLKQEQPLPDVRQAGYMHFPSDRDLGYFVQLVSERLISKKVGATRFSVWDLPSGKANEALDCRVYALAALHGLMHRGLSLNRLAAGVVDGVPAGLAMPAAQAPIVLPSARPPPTPAAAPPPPPRSMPRRSRWAT